MSQFSLSKVIVMQFIFVLLSLVFLVNTKRDFFFLHGSWFVHKGAQHYLLYSHLWGLLLHCLLDFQRRQLVRVANTNDQITLSLIGSHCRQKANILFHSCVRSIKYYYTLKPHSLNLKTKHKTCTDILGCFLVCLAISNSTTISVWLTTTYVFVS